MEKKLERLIFLQTQKKQIEDSIKNKSYYFFIIYSLLLIVVGLVIEPPTTWMPGLLRILTSPSNLITDYIQLGSLGSAFMNSGLLTLASLLLAKHQKITIHGSLIAALFTVSGCSFFGKNLYNSIPIILGGYLYARLVKKPFSQFTVISLFGSALSPIVSYITFGMHLPLIIGVPISYLTGILIGVALPSFAVHVLTFHQGFSLYNAGFASGILAMLITNGFRMFNQRVEFHAIISTDFHRGLLWFLIFLFTCMFLTGYVLNHRSFDGLDKIHATSGKLITDFIAIANVGPTLMNMALMGGLLLGYVCLSQTPLNGPLVGAILSAVGFSAFGNHVLNSLPILIGVFLAAQLGSALEVDHLTVALAGVFGTSLAPIAGYYGATWGVIAGFIHLSLVVNIGYLHGGLNLYNNGFSSGFVAAFMVPLLDNVFQVRRVKKKCKKKKRQNEL